jgi:hypothetical protein
MMMTFVLSDLVLVMDMVGCLPSWACSSEVDA